MLFLARIVAARAELRGLMGPEIHMPRGRVVEIIHEFEEGHAYALAVVGDARVSGLLAPDTYEPAPEPVSPSAVLRHEYLWLFGPVPEDGARAVPRANTPPADPESDSHPAGCAPVEPAEVADEREAEAAAVEAISRKLNAREPAALCLSGGGIRSATFSLGVLQGLARCGLLTQFDYLSTVSGGGFIGSWLTSWARRHDGGMAGVQKELAQAGASPEHPEPPEVRHLRDYSNYLSPRLSLVSADTWTLAAIYFRNLLINWLVFLPILLALLVLPRIIAAVMDVFPIAPPGCYGHEHEPGAASGRSFIRIAIGLAACAFAYAGLTQPSALQYWERRGSAAPGGPRRPARGDGVYAALCWLSRQRQFLLFCWLPLLAAAVYLSVGWAWIPEPAWCIPKWKFIVPVMVVGAIGSGVAFASRTLSFVLRGTGQGQPPRAGTAWYSLKQFGCVLAAACVTGWALWGAACLLDALSEWFDTSWAGWDANARNGFETAVYVCAAIPLVLLGFRVGGIVNVALNSRLTRPAPPETHRRVADGDEDREWWSRFGGWVLIAIALWSVGSALVLLAPALLLYLGGAARAAVAAAGGISGAVTVLLGKSAATSAAGEAEARPRGAAARLKRGASQVLLAVLAPVFIILLLAALGLATDYLLRIRVARWDSGALGAAAAPYLDCWQTHLTVPDPVKGSAPVGVALPPVQQHFALVEGPDHVPGHGLQWLAFVTAWGFGLGAAGLLVSLFINLNKFSLHGTFRNRLIRAYLGASNRRRAPHPFTGLDSADNLPMHALRPVRPLHVVNMALNLAAGHQLAWQQRKAESFVMTPWHCGSAELGYRASSLYGEEISLGTALTISGAAVSPNMGYHSSPPIAFLLTLFNVRLGWWLGNPGAAGNRTYRRPAPLCGAKPIIAEALGLTDDCHPYVYLSDGGHFDNLGLYEMVRRRCRRIFLIDAGQDAGFAFDDLGSAVRKAYTDFGVRIHFADVHRIGEKDGGAAPTPGAGGPAYYAVGTIQYGARPNPAVDGTLLYIKPAYYGRGEPIDVYSYAKGCPDFPHETTADQFFSESQFESYRRLGEFVLGRVIRGAGGENPVDSLDDLFRGLVNHR